MADLTTIFAFNRDTELFIAKETVFGTEVKPGPTGLVLITGAGEAQQPRIYNEDAQRRNTYGRLDRLQAGFGAGTLNFPTYVKPSGSLGVVPEGAVLYESWMGIETINASTSVVYSQLAIGGTRPSFTAWLKVGHIVYRGLGCVVDQGVMEVNGGNDAYANMAWTCSFAQLLWTGTDRLSSAVDGTTTPVTAIPVDDARKFTVGGYIEFPGDDNAGAGYEVTAVDYGTNTLTITPGTNQLHAIESLVSPWVPTGTEVGKPVASRLGLATYAGATIRVLSSSVTQQNGVLVDEGEKNDKDFPDRFFNGDRAVNITSTIRMDADATRFIRIHTEDERAVVVIPAGNVAGSIVELNVANVGLDFPTHDDDTRRAMTVAGEAFESASLNDSLTVTFK